MRVEENLIGDCQTKKEDTRKNVYENQSYLLAGRLHWDLTASLICNNSDDSFEWRLNEDEKN